MKRKPKIIHLSDDIKKQLIKMAADEGKDLKNFIQDKLTEIAKCYRS